MKQWEIKEGKTLCFEVRDEKNFYDGMVGFLTHENDRALVLKFNLPPSLGGVNIVQFYKTQLEYAGEYDAIEDKKLWK